MRTRLKFYPRTEASKAGSINYWFYLSSTQSAVFNEPVVLACSLTAGITDSLDLTSGTQFLTIKGSKSFSSQYFTFYFWGSMMEAVIKGGVNCKLMEFKREEDSGSMTSVILLRLISDASSVNISISYQGSTLSIQKLCNYIYIYIYRQRAI